MCFDLHTMHISESVSNGHFPGTNCAVKYFDKRPNERDDPITTSFVPVKMCSTFQFLFTVTKRRKLGQG